MKNIKGFTLIEMVIIITVISILIMIGKGAYNGQIERSKFAEAYTTTSAIMTAQKDFYIVNKRFATDLEELGFLLDGEPAKGSWNAGVNGVKTKAFKFTTYPKTGTTNIACIEVIRDIPKGDGKIGLRYELRFVANDSTTGITDSFVSIVSDEGRCETREIQKELDKMKESFNNKIW